MQNVTDTIKRERSKCYKFCHLSESEFVNEINHPTHVILIVNPPKIHTFCHINKNLLIVHTIVNHLSK